MDAIEKEPSIGISYTCELPGKKALVMQSFVPRDCEPAELDRVLDKIRDASERQFAFGALVQLRLQLEQEEKMAADHARNIAIVDENVKTRWSASGRKGDPRLSAAEETQQRQSYQNVEESKKRIARVKKEITEFEAKIGVQPGA